MSWPAPQCVTRTLRLLSRSRQPWEPSRQQQRTRVSIPNRFQRCQRRTFSNTSSKATAAPPIDFTQPGAVPARILPASPAYFTGTPRYTEQLVELEQLQAKYAMLPLVSAAEAPRMAWLRLPAFREKIGEVVPISRYRRFIKILQRLNRIDRNLAPPEVTETMQNFLRPDNPYGQTRKIPTIDEMGRARGIGRRKTSSAQAWLVEGEGHVLVNDRSIVDIFPRLHDRESALWALRSTGRLDKYNVWALAKGGGLTGQAEAITVAIARALMVHEPALKPILRKAGVVTMDPRQVERKKPGHVKARKMPQWVRR